MDIEVPVIGSEVGARSAKMHVPWVLGERGYHACTMEYVGFLKFNLNNIII